MAPQGLAQKRENPKWEFIIFPQLVLQFVSSVILSPQKRSIHDRQGDVKYDVTVAVHAPTSQEAYSSSFPTSDTTAIYVGGISTWHGDGSQDA
jgi:hypothetical protein